MFRLDKMEIQGFKSFYGRTQFEFRPGITAVVGPNGCGKSNISDAISWVLGDQSPRSLRADRMEDVIFNGSEARKPTGMAEVTLRFLGTNGGPEPEELIVRRRLFRNGESEYSLNGSRCRLKDIQEMLVHSRVGSHVYSVIEQGKVDVILSAKPKDRRALFEEAAGILGYKLKRRIALGKLEATQTNLVRIKDILGEVRKQTNSLRRQVAKARRYQRLQGKIRARRGSLLRAKLVDFERLGTAADAARSELAVLEAGLSAELARCGSEVEALRLRFEQAEADARGGRERLNELDREIDRSRLLAERSREQLEASRRAQERWGQESAELGSRLEAREAKLVERRGLLDEGKRSLEILETSLREQEEEQRMRVEGVLRMEEDAEACRGALLAVLDQLAEERNRSQRIDENLRRVVERRRQLVEEIRRQQGEQENLRVELDELSVLVTSKQSELERVRREREFAAESLAGEERALQELAAGRELLAERAAHIQERLRALEEADTAASGNGRGIEAVLAVARQGRLRIRGRVADALEVDPEWLPAAEAVLREVLGAVIAEDRGEALSGVRYLKENVQGRCAFLPASGTGTPKRQIPEDLLIDPRFCGSLSEKVRPVGEEIEALGELLRETLIVESLDAGLEMHRRHRAWNYVTIAGDLVRASGLIHGGAAEPEGSGPLSWSRERAEQESQLEAAKADRERLESEREGREESRRLLVTRLSVLEERIRERDRECVEARLRLDQRQENRERTQLALRVAEEELSRLVAEEMAGSVEVGLLADTLAATESNRRTLEERIATTAVGLARRREVATAGAETLGSFRSRVAVERQRAASGLEEVAALDQLAAEERERLEKAEAEARGAVGQAETLEAAIRDLADSLERGQGDRGKVAAGLEKIEVEVMSLKTELHAAEQLEKTARSKLDELRVRISEANVTAARLCVEGQHLETSCREELGMKLEEVRALPPPERETSFQTLEQEMVELRGRLEGLGAVNLAALDQYREMEERHGFLARQEKDLEESIESLNDTIRKINRTSRERFLETFERIQEEFNRTFVTLFGGGRAELRLMEDEDILECGIEIIASPPGKRLQSISLLSGGEKAMTAVALLFAIFRYRPSPFCVLDEVDAPLDEANVGRFTRMLRELTRETQFILITHNRRSMEAADLLYGITMEEPGISKVVSMRLEN